MKCINGYNSPHISSCHFCFVLDLINITAVILWLPNLGALCTEHNKYQSVKGHFVTTRHTIESRLSKWIISLVNYTYKIICGRGKNITTIVNLFIFNMPFTRMSKFDDGDHILTFRTIPCVRFVPAESKICHVYCSSICVCYTFEVWFERQSHFTNKLHQKLLGLTEWPGVMFVLGCKMMTFCYNNFQYKLIISKVCLLV